MDKRDPGWELYRSFLAVLREGSLSGAARVLGLTQTHRGSAYPGTAIVAWHRVVYARS